ncbi:MAG: hypothetical protein LBC25_02650 [Holosporales bacterium]|jgi:hypothetical protein|nr:hypothetical protein [Holosporales bacterium]
MGFWRKAFLFGVVIVSSVLLQTIAPSIGQIEISLPGYGFQIQNYALITALLVLIFFWIILRAIYKLLLRCFSWTSGNKTDEEIANSIATLILADDHEFLSMTMRTTLPPRLQIIKTALILLRGNNKLEVTDETAVQIVNIHIIKRHIQKLLHQRDIIKSIELVEKALNKYARYAAVIQDEILEVAMISKENNIKFHFEPRKFKYSLSSSFIEKYHTSIALLEFHLEHNDETKCKIIEKVFHEYPANHRVATTFLDFIIERGHDDHTDKQIIDIIGQIFALNPNRVFANFLLKVNRKDLFEVAQKIVQPLAETNIERAWFMLIISTKLHLLAKAKEIIGQHLGDSIHAFDLARFYVQNYVELSKDAEIFETIKRICDGY